MYHSVVKIPSGFDVQLISMKSKKIIQPVIERENMNEYVLLNGLYMLILYDTEEKASWLKSYLKVNYSFDFQLIDGVWICKFLIHNGSMIQLKFKGNLSNFLKQSKTEQEKSK